jgi:hypothetical protein
LSNSQETTAEFDISAHDPEEYPMRELHRSETLAVSGAGFFDDLNKYLNDLAVAENAWINQTFIQPIIRSVFTFGKSIIDLFVKT